MLFRILIRDFMRGYSDKDIASATKKLEGNTFQRLQFTELTSKEWKAVTKKELLNNLFGLTRMSRIRIKD